MQPVQTIEQYLILALTQQRDEAHNNMARLVAVANLHLAEKDARIAELAESLRNLENAVVAANEQISKLSFEIVELKKVTIVGNQRLEDEK